MIRTKHKKQNHIVYVKGDIFEYVPHYISNNQNGCSVIVPHVCNNIGAFGAGFVAAINKHYPIVKENYQLLSPQFLKQNLGYTQFVEVAHNKTYDYKIIFANMIAQNGVLSNNNQRPLDYFALVKCMSSVNRYIENNFLNDSRPPQIHCPKFGCGLAGGNWSLIENLIEDIWHNQVVFVYSI